MNNHPLVTCIMPTAGRTELVCQAISYFLAQDYPNKELLIVYDRDEPADDGDDPRVRRMHLHQSAALGAKRNLACKEAAGEIIVHWDDDDWMAPWRLSYQVRALTDSNAAVCGLDKLYFYEPERDQAWLYVYPERARFWVAGATLCYLKAFWRENPFPNINVGEDTRFVWSGDARRMIALPDASFYVAMIHRGNTSRKRTSDPRYQPVATDQIRQLIDSDFETHSRLFLNQ